MRNFMSCNPHQILFVDYMKKHEMGEARRTYGGEERCIRGLMRKSEEREELKGLGIDKRIILKLIFKKWDRDMDLIGLVQNRDKWRALVYTAMNLRVS
jgi:hypothetical protein